MKELFIDFTKPKKMKIKGFDLIQKKIKGFYFYPPNNIDSKIWYFKFEKIINTQLKKKIFFPIFRMSDGEFIFLLGRRFGHYVGFKKYLWIFQHIKRSLYYRSTFYSSGRKGYCETYSIFKLNKLRKNFLKYLKKISQIGIICPNFSPDLLTKPYQEDVLKKLTENKIFLNKYNYFAYYFISVFFMGNKINKIFLNKSILFITSDMPERNKNLKNNLIRFGAKNVDFYFTSLNQPMYDVIDLKKIIRKPDLVFVAAGVGSSNILLQLRKLKCLCIDCGFLVDAFSDIKLAKLRAFHLNDKYYYKKTWF